MVDFLSARLGLRFFEQLPELINQLVIEKQKANEIAEAALYPFPDLCRRCANKDTDDCVHCRPLQASRACYYRNKDA